MAGSTENKPVCCDVDQVTTMISSFQMTKIFARCPTCLHNMISQLCVLSCSPEQETYIIPTKILQDGNLEPPGNGMFRIKKFSDGSEESYSEIIPRSFIVFDDTEEFHTLR